MQVELFGCTSAGKSSLLTEILRSHPAQQTAITCGNDFLLRRMRLAWMTGTLRLVVLNLLSISMCLFAWRKYRVFLRHVVTCIRQRRQDVSLFERLRILRIALRNVGLYEFVERYAAADQVVFTDEGMLQVAHYLFVHIAVEPRAESIESFAKLVPLPSVVVYLCQPDALLIERTSQRGHKRIPPGSAELVTRFVTRATAVFETLIQQPALLDKLLMIDGEQRVLTATKATMDAELEYVCDLIRPALSGGKQERNC